MSTVGHDDVAPLNRVRTLVKRTRTFIAPAHTILHQHALRRFRSAADISELYGDGNWFCDVCKTWQPGGGLQEIRGEGVAPICHCIHEGCEFDVCEACMALHSLEADEAPAHDSDTEHDSEALSEPEGH